MRNVVRFNAVPLAEANSKAPVSEQAEAAVQVRDLEFRWQASHKPVLDIGTLTINRGEHIFIEGPSGGGKSTLLSLLAGVAVPQAGSVSVMGQALETLGGARRDRFRSDHIGFIFQMFNLIPYLSMVENVTLPCRFSSKRQAEARRTSVTPEDEALRLLAQLGLNDPALLRRPVTELSVGQQQRVAAARALIGAPEIVIADEPTSALDYRHREDFIQLLFAECDKTDTTLIFASHDISLAPLFDRALSLDTINQTARVTEPGKGGVP